MQAIINANANCRITYFPHGVYLVTKTLHIPSGSKIVGEVWSIISASGDYFRDITNPRPLLQVGNPGESGSVECSDILVTVADILSGAVLVEVNMAPSSPGAISFHNVHSRVGGAADSLTETNCQSQDDPCKAAFLHVHLTATSGSYWENSWLWTADHDLDGTYPITMGVGRGMLVESTHPTHLIGSASEHQVMYAYQFNNAQNVQASMMQVESPYWQPLDVAPAPWTPNATWSDPTFDCTGQSASCGMQWHLRMLGIATSTIALYGQAFWVFFNDNSGDCSAGPDNTCQTNAVDLELTGKGENVEIYNLNTRAVYDLIRLGGSSGFIAAGQPTNYGSWGGQITAYLGFE